MAVSKYKSMSLEELEAIYDNYLIDSWSYSKLSSFARNEKAFEMNYIYNERSRRSSTTVAGNAYHEALKWYFTYKQDGSEIGAPEMDAIAFEYLDEFPSNMWKLQKTTPTVADCMEKANKLALSLIRNFLGERSIYEDDIEDIIFVEQYFNEFVMVNGVDIPLPCHAIEDLAIRTKSGKYVIIDHKSKNTYTDEKELKLTGAKQAMTYVLVFEAHYGIQVDEVWFIENKYSQNKDKSPQLRKFVVPIDDSTRRLYESLLYEPLRRMLEAVSDPDYVYLINDSDNFVDMAEVLNFWAKTMIAEISEFDIKPSKREVLERRLRKIRDAELVMINPKIIQKFKKETADFIPYDLSNSNMNSQQIIEHTLRTFSIMAEVAHVFDGYSCNTYLLDISSGTRVDSIKSYKSDIARALNVPRVRIANELTVYQGRAFVRIEAPKKAERTVLWDEKHLSGMKIPIGLDNFDNPVYWDLNNHSTPHVLVCGATGSGKSVMLRSTIEYAIRAGVGEVVIMDPKYEFSGMTIPGARVISDILEIEEEMIRQVEQMEERIKMGPNGKRIIIFDEFADAVANSRKGAALKVYSMVQEGLYANGSPKMKRTQTDEVKSLEENLRILLQKGRSVGFRVVCATQRASVKVITGDAKANLPVQICFRVPKEVDSMVVLDEPGAESLAGRGDGLMRSPEYDNLVRFQGFYYE